MTLAGCDRERDAAIDSNRADGESISSGCNRVTRSHRGAVDHNTIRRHRSRCLQFTRAGLVKKLGVAGKDVFSRTRRLVQERWEQIRSRRGVVADRCAADRLPRWAATRVTLELVVRGVVSQHARDGRSGLLTRRSFADQQGTGRSKPRVRRGYKRANGRAGARERRDVSAGSGQRRDVGAGARQRGHRSRRYGYIRKRQAADREATDSRYRKRRIRTGQAARVRAQFYNGAAAVHREQPTISGIDGDLSAPGQIGQVGCAGN